MLRAPPTHTNTHTSAHTSAQRQNINKLQQDHRDQSEEHTQALCVFVTLRLKNDKYQTLLFIMNLRSESVNAPSLILLAHPMVSGCLNEVAVIFCLCAFSVICHMITEAVLVCLYNANVFQFPPHKDHTSLIQKMA